MYSKERLERDPLVLRMHPPGARLPGSGRPPRKQAYVRKSQDIPGWWAVSTRDSRASFRSSFPNRDLAAFVARLLIGALDPKGEKHGPEGVNFYSERLKAETSYDKAGCSVLWINRQDQEDVMPLVAVVSKRAALSARYYPWFECKGKKGVPDAVAVRPVLTFNPRTKGVLLEWVTLESCIKGKGMLPDWAGKGAVTHPGVYFNKKSQETVDLRFPGSAEINWEQMAEVRKKMKKLARRRHNFIYEKKDGVARLRAKNVPGGGKKKLTGGVITLKKLGNDLIRTVNP